MPDSNTASPSLPVSVLFVCLGNICRSPMAEGVFRSLTCHGVPDADPRIRNIDSCGTGAYHVGDAPDSRTLSVLAKHGITSKHYKHEARKFEPEDFERFDYIFAMDRDNLRTLEQARRRFIKAGKLDDDGAGQVKLWGAYGGQGQEEVADPYYGANNGFDTAYEQMVRFSNGFLSSLGAEK